MTPPFEIFGRAHLAVMCVVAAAGVALPWWVRRRPARGRPVRLALVASLVSLTAAYVAALSREGPFSVWDLVPLHLCDFLLLVAAFALVTLNRPACELLYFWGLTGALLATITPDLAVGWPGWRFVVYFGLHGAIVVAAALVAFGLGRPPRRGAAWRVLLVTNAYAAVVGLVDAVWGMNFLYLRGKPSAPTLLDWLGPWPVYLVVVDAVALGLFLLLETPFRVGGRSRLRWRQLAD